MTHEKWGMFGSGGEEERLIGQQTLAAIDQREASLIETMQTPEGFNQTLMLFVTAQTPESFVAAHRDVQTAVLSLASMEITRLSIAASQQTID